MINGIISLISNAIYDEFGEGYMAYAEDVDQEFVKPCFVVSAINTSVQSYPSMRKRWQNIFCVHYYPVGPKYKQENYAIAERLFQCLEYIGQGESLMRGINMNYELNENELYFFVSYNYFSMAEKSAELMEELKTDVEPRGGNTYGGKKKSS